MRKSKRYEWLVTAILERTESCVIWPFAADCRGRGRVRRQPAHRMAYELLNGPIPSGMHVLHRCDTPACVNPNHLFLGTHADNMRDMADKGRASRGEKSPQAKLTLEQVKAIRENNLSSRKIAPLYGISDRQIRSIRANQWWKHA